MSANGKVIHALHVSVTRPSQGEAGFLTTLVWAKEAPAKLVEAATAGDQNRFSRQLLRKGLPQPAKLGAITDPCRQAAWMFRAADSDTVEHLTRELLLEAARKGGDDLLANHLTALLDAADNRASLQQEVLGAWLTLLAYAGTRFPVSLLERFWSRTFLEVRQLLEAPAASSDDPLSCDAELRDEIAFRAGIVFAPLAIADSWHKQGREGWRERIASATDEQAQPLLGADRYLEWLASLTRLLSDAESFACTPWKKKRHLLQLQRMWTWACAGLTADGPLAGGGHQQHWAAEMLASFGRLLGEKKSHPALRLADGVARQKQVGARLAPKGQKQLYRPARQSDEAAVAILRNHWGTSTALCHVNHARPEVRLDVSIAGRPLIQGGWEVNVSVDGQPVMLQSHWQCDCWVSDADADFIEISASLGEGVRLMRQICLARKDKLLVLAEAVRGASSETSLELTSTLPLSTGLQPEADGITRELQIPLETRRVRCFPVHLPWERTTSSDGTCRITEDGITSQISGLGGRCQVLFLEWTNARGQEPADATPLLVAENLQKVPASEACAGRLRIGRRQWLYMHNLIPGRVPRSVLGCHTMSETVIGRFGEAGAVEYLVHVLGATQGEEPSNS